MSTALGTDVSFWGELLHSTGFIKKKKAAVKYIYGIKL